MRPLEEGHWVSKTPFLEIGETPFCGILQIELSNPNFLGWYYHQRWDTSNQPWIRNEIWKHIKRLTSWESKGTVTKCKYDQRKKYTKYWSMYISNHLHMHEGDLAFKTWQKELKFQAYPKRSGYSKNKGGTCKHSLQIIIWISMFQHISPPFEKFSVRTSTTNSTTNGGKSRFFLHGSQPGHCL